MRITERTHSTDETEALGKLLAKLLEDNKISSAFIAMRGEMGVGKTAFTRGFAEHFGIVGVKSPTYTVLNEHKGRVAIHHFDFYRISDADELATVGYDEIIEGDGFTVGEWIENIEDMLPDDIITVTISRVGFDLAQENERDIEINIPMLEA